MRSRYLGTAAFPCFHFKLPSPPCCAPQKRTDRHASSSSFLASLGPFFLPSHSQEKRKSSQSHRSFIVCAYHTIFYYREIIPSSNLCPALDYEESVGRQGAERAFPMDATRLPFRSTSCVSGGRYGLSSFNIHRRCLESRQATSPCMLGASAKAIRSRRSIVASFADGGHATYYQSTPKATCVGSSSREAEKTTKDKGGIRGRHSECKELKKKLERVEGLLRITVSTMVFDEKTQGEAASFAHDRVLAVSKFGSVTFTVPILFFFFIVFFVLERKWFFFISVIYTFKSSSVTS